MIFQPGDRALIVNPQDAELVGDIAARYIGCEVSIHEGPLKALCTGNVWETYYVCLTDDGVLLEIGAKYLQKPPPRHTELLGSWDECPWRPERVAA